MANDTRARANARGAARASNIAAAGNASTLNLRGRSLLRGADRAASSNNASVRDAFQRFTGDQSTVPDAFNIKSTGTTGRSGVVVGRDPLSGRAERMTAAEANAARQGAERKQVLLNQPVGSNLKTELDETTRKFAEERGIDISTAFDVGGKKMIDLGQVTQQDLLNLTIAKSSSRAKRLQEEADALYAVGRTNEAKNVEQEAMNARQRAERFSGALDTIFQDSDPSKFEEGTKVLKEAGLEFGIDPEGFGFDPKVLDLVRSPEGKAFRDVSGSNVDIQEKDDLQKELDQIDQDLLNLVQTGTAGPNAAIIAQERKANAIAQHKMKQDQQSAEDQAEQERIQRRKEGVSQTANALNNGALAALTNSLPEEFKFLGEAFGGIHEVLDQQEGDAEGIRSDRFNLAEQIYDGQMSLLDGFQKIYQEERNMLQGILDTVRDDSVQQLADREARADERLKWDEIKITKDLEKQKNDQIEQATAALAISGGFGSSNGLKAISEAERGWDTAIAEAKMEFSMKRADLAVDFNGQYLEIQSKYRLDSFNATKEFNRLNQEILQQGFSSSVARAEAEQKAMDDYINKIGEIRTAKAGNLKELANTVYTTVNAERTRKQNEKSLAFEELKWYKGTFGSNPPAGVIDDLNKRLPGVDVQSFFETKTLEEIEAEKKASSGGGFSFNFLPSETNGVGEPISIEDFLDQKMSLAEEEAAQSFSPEQRAKVLAENREEWENEYKAKQTNAERYNPAQIVQRLNDKMSQPGIAKHTRENAQQVVQGYLQNGQYGLAAEYVAGLGKPVPPSQSKSFTALTNAIYQLDRIDNVLDRLGSQGPVIGRLRNLNAWDDDFVELNQLLTQITPQLSRGVFLEVGVLTDNDINRYKGTLANGNLTYSQAQQAQQNIRDLIQKSLELQMGTWEATGHRTSDLKQFYDTEFSGSDQRKNSSEDMTVSTQADIDYLQSLNLQ